jgi:anti-sigma factor ChrR (cupin superfamily)
MRLRRGDDHAWSQQHLSHYVEGDLSWLARRRLELHAQECPDCSRGIRAVRGLLRLLHGSDKPSDVTAPAAIFDRVRADAAHTTSGADRADEA